MKVLLILLMIEVLGLAIWAALVVQLEAIKDEIVSALKDKALKNELYGKFTAAMHQDNPTAAGRVPPLDVMAEAKAKAQPPIKDTSGGN